jgi:hypothetical protein
MKNLTLALMFATATLTAAACGDSESDSDGDGNKGGSSGSSGSGGASGASGTSGSSGTGTTGGTAGSAPTGGTAGAPTGGTASGGTSGAAGQGADGGVGAEGGMGADGGMNGGGDGPGPSADCPGAEPTPATACPTRGLSCDFGDRVCRCNVSTGSWNCFDENGDCPAMPDPNGNCMGGQTACSYGESGTCICAAGNFNCDSGVVSCPATRPTDGAGCTMFPSGFDCSYPAGDCSCMAAGGGGATRTWNCQDSACPATAPNNGGNCPDPGLICDYPTPGPGADPTCVCNTMSQWTCL